MSRLNPQRQKELFETNSKSRFRMYKAGKQWLVAGVATLSGLFGLGVVAGAPVHASTVTPGVGKEAGASNVLANQNSATIPASSDKGSEATSQSTSESQSTTESESNSTTQSTSESQSTSTSASASISASTSISVSKSISESTSKSISEKNSETTSESTAKSDSTTKSQSDSTTQSESQTKSNSTTASESASQSTTESASKSASTSISESNSSSLSKSASDSASESQSLSASRSMDQLVTQLNETIASKVSPAKAAMFKAALANNEFTITDQKDFQSGQSLAASDLKSIISNIDIKGLGLVFIGNVSPAVTQLANLIDDYLKNPNLYTNTTITSNTTGDNAYNPIWKPTSRSGNGPLGNENGTHWPKADSDVVFGFKVNSSLPSFNAGYVTYLRAYVQGILADLQSVKDQASNATVANSLINNSNYDNGALSGSSLSGVVTNGLSAIWNIFWGNFNVPSALQGYNDTSVAASNVNNTVTYLNNLVGIVAPYIINGIAHQALADVRSIGNAKMGTDGVIDYAPDHFVDAVNLNQNIAKFLGLVGLGNVISSNLMQYVYDAVKTVAQAAIMNNWGKGEIAALNNLMNGGAYVNGKGIYSNVAGYDETQPWLIAASSQSTPLSTVTEATAYAWTMYVFRQLLQNAAADAVNNAATGQQLPSNDQLLAQIIASLPISDANKALIKTDNVTNVIISDVPTTAYARTSKGARETLLNTYLAEYNAVAKAISDFKANQKLSDDDLKANQAQLNYVTPGDPGLTTNGGAGVTTTIVPQDYTKTYQYLRDAMYQGQTAADTQSHKQLDGNVQPSPLAGVKFSGKNALLTVQTTPVSTQLSSLAQQYFNQAYAEEAERANASFAAGIQKAKEQIAAHPGQPVPAVSDAGTITIDGKTFSYSNDLTATEYKPYSYPITGAQVTGQGFIDGYQSLLTTMTVTLQKDPKDPSGATFPTKTYDILVPTNIETTVLPNNGTAITGWVPNLSKITGTWTEKTQTITFLYRKASNLVSTTISNPTDSREDNDQILNYPDIDPTITFTWSDGTTQKVENFKFSSIVQNPDMHQYFYYAITSQPGKYNIQLSAAGAKVIQDWIANTLGFTSTGTYEIPDTMLDLLPLNFDFTITEKPVVHTATVTSKKNLTYTVGDPIPTAKDALDYVVVDGVKYDASEIQWNADGTGTINGVGTIKLDWTIDTANLQTPGTYNGAANLTLTLTADGSTHQDLVNVISVEKSHTVTINNQHNVVYIIGKDLPTAKSSFNTVTIDGKTYKTSDITWSSDGQTGTIDGVGTITLEWTPSSDAIQTAGWHYAAANTVVTLTDGSKYAQYLNVYSTESSDMAVTVNSKKNIGYISGDEIPTAKDVYDYVVVNGIKYGMDQITWNADGTVGTIDGVGTVTLVWAGDPSKSIQDEGWHMGAAKLTLQVTGDGSTHVDTVNVYTTPNIPKESESASTSASTSESDQASTSASASTSTSGSVSTSSSESVSASTSTSRSISENDVASDSASKSKSQSTSDEGNKSDSASQSTATSESDHASQSISASTSASQSSKDSTSESTPDANSKSTSASQSGSLSASTSTSESQWASKSTSASNSTSTSASESASISDKDSSSASTSESENKPGSTSVSDSDRDSASDSAKQSDSSSKSTSVSESDRASVSDSSSRDTSTSESASRSESRSTDSDASISESTSSSKSQSVSYSTSESNQASDSTSVSDNDRDSTSESINDSKVDSASTSTSSSISASTSDSKSSSDRHDESTSASTSTSDSASTSGSESKSFSDSVSGSTSESSWKSESTSTSVSDHTSTSTSESTSTSVSDHTSTSTSESTSTSVSDHTSTSTSESTSTSVSDHTSTSTSESTSTSVSDHTSTSTSESTSTSVSDHTSTSTSESTSTSVSDHTSTSTSESTSTSVSDHTSTSTSESTSTSVSDHTSTSTSESTSTSVSDHTS
ncbi:KxYKxGKxW signal peptide domain-containing protein, partial [Lacticaseibacillus paracasei]